MDKNNKYYGIIEQLVRNHRKFKNYEPILDDIIDDVYSHSEAVLSSLDNENVINSYLTKVVSTSIITVPKKLNFHAESAPRTITITQEKPIVAAPPERPAIQEITPVVSEISPLEEQQEENTISLVAAEEINLVSEEIAPVEEITPEEAKTETETYDTHYIQESGVDTELVDKMINSADPVSYNETETVIVSDEGNMLQEIETTLDTEPVEDNITEDFVTVQEEELQTADFESTEITDHQEFLTEETPVENEDIKLTFTDDNSFEETETIITEEPANGLQEAVAKTTDLLTTENIETATDSFEAIDTLQSDSTEDLTEITDEGPDVYDSVEDATVNTIEIDDNQADEVQLVFEQNDETVEMALPENEIQFELENDFQDNQIVDNTSDIDIQPSNDSLNIVEESVTDNFIQDDSTDTVLTNYDTDLGANDETEISLNMEEDNSQGIGISLEDNAEAAGIGFSLEENNSQDISIGFETDIVEPELGIDLNDSSQDIGTGLEEIAEVPEISIDFSENDDNQDIGISLEAATDEPGIGISLENSSQDISIDLASDANESDFDISLTNDTAEQNQVITDTEPEPVNAEKESKPVQKSELNINNIMGSIRTLDTMNPELNIMKIYDLKYNKGYKISDIAQFSGMSRNDVIKALNMMIEVV